MILIIILCLRCWGTGRLGIISKKRRFTGVGNCLPRYMGLIRRGFMPLFLEATAPKGLMSIRRHIRFGVIFWRMIRFCMDQKRITSGRWAIQDLVARVPKYILT